MKVRVGKSQARFKRIRDPQGPDTGEGIFLLYIDVTAQSETLYIPVSIASGKKPAGFIYQIEGTGEGKISMTDISCSGDGVTHITLGTIVYAKIPAGRTATFRLLVEIRGKVGKTYSIVINRINYKHDSADVRYERYEETLRSRSVQFR